jgi:hypothetical protein
MEKTEAYFSTITHKVIVVQGDNAYDSWTGLVSPAIPRLASLILNENDTDAYVAGTRLYSTLAQLNDMMTPEASGWRMRISTRRRSVMAKDGKRSVLGQFFVDYMALYTRSRMPQGKRRKTRRIDVINLELFKEPPPEDINEQMSMAIAILELCESRKTRFRNTRGSLASAFMKQSPHWEVGRHAAPKFINQTAREHLPGNFYSVAQGPRKPGTKFGGTVFDHCYYLDQKSSHHAIALSTPVPHPQQLHARGYYQRAMERDYRRWADPNSDVGRGILNGSQIGLVVARVYISTIPRSLAHLYPPWATHKGGQKYVWLWTPELRLFQGDHRLQLEHFVCGITADTADPVIPEYADWSLKQLKVNAQRKRTTKSILLAGYGMLAFNARQYDIYHYWGGRNTKAKVHIPIAGVVGETRIRLPEDVEPSIVNVAARGIIEAEARTRSIEYARQLTGEGLHVPQIYADGLLVHTDTLPFLPDGWDVSHSLTHVTIPRPNAIVSRELVKLPGVSHRSEEDREWLTERAAIAPIQARQVTEYV